MWQHRSSTSDHNCMKGGNHGQSPYPLWSWGGYCTNCLNKIGSLGKHQGPLSPSPLKKKTINKSPQCWNFLFALASRNDVCRQVLVWSIWPMCCHPWRWNSLGLIGFIWSPTGKPPAGWLQLQGVFCCWRTSCKMHGTWSWCLFGCWRKDVGKILLPLKSVVNLRKTC